MTNPGPDPNPIPSPNPNPVPNPDPNPNASPSPSPNPNPEQGNQLGAAPPALRRALARNDAVLRLSFSLGGAAAAAAAAARTEETSLPPPPPLPLSQPHPCLGGCRSARPRALGRLQVGPRPETDPAVLFAASAEAERTAERSAEVALRAEAAEEDPAGLAQGRPEQERQLVNERPPHGHRPPAPDCSPRRRSHYQGRPVHLPSLSPARLAACSPGRRVAGASLSEYRVVLEEARERPRESSAASAEELEFELEPVEEPQPEGIGPRRV